MDGGPLNGTVERPLDLTNVQLRIFLLCTDELAVVGARPEKNTRSTASVPADLLRREHSLGAKHAGDALN
jgi:hypothetical protein